MEAVISLGGSVLGFPPDVEWLKKFRSFVEEFRGSIYAIVVGGGPLARNMIKVARSFGVSNTVLDEIGIQATILNAWVVRSALDGLVWDLPVRFSGPVPRGERIPLFGGSVLPGVTTDFVGALLADYYGVAFVNVTRVGGIYTSDPSKDPGAELIDRITYEELLDLAASSDDRSPGTNFPIDLVSLYILRRSRIPSYVVGPDIENLRNLFRGEEWTGTEIVP